MAKSTRRQGQSGRQGAPPAKPPLLAVQQLQLGYDPSGPKQPVDIVATKEAWSEFTLEDGTVLRSKAIVLDVRKMANQYNTDGEPIYEMQLTMVTQARVPDTLKKR